MSMTCPHCSKAVSEAIPKHRLDQEIEKRKTAESELSQVKETVAELSNKAKLGEQAAERVSSLEGELSSTKENHSIDLKLGELGIHDPDVREGFGRAWRKSAEKPADRKAFETWLAEYAKTPDQASGLLRPHLPGVDEEGKLTPRATKTGATGEGQPKPTPNLGGSGQGSPPAAKGGFSVDDLRAMRDKKGGLAEYAAKRKAIGAQAGMTLPDLPESNPYSKFSEPEQK